MADRFPRLLFVSFMLILTFILCSPAARRQGEEATVAATTNSTSNSTDMDQGIDEQDPEQLTCVYKGKWRTDSPRLFDRLSSDSGLTFFQCRSTRLSVDCSLYFFDGHWQDDTLYLLLLKNLTYSDQGKMIAYQNHTAMLFSRTEYNFANYQVNGSISFTGEEGSREATVVFASNDTVVSSEFTEFTEEERKSPKKVYCGMYTILSLAVIFAIKRLQGALDTSPRAAAKICIGFLLANSVIDTFLCLWHLSLAFQDSHNFDFFLLASFGSFFASMMIYGRLLPVVWRAQNQEVVSWGSLREREVFAAFRNRYMLSVLLSVLMLVLFSAAFQFTVIALHFFFLPQIAVNAYRGHKNAIKSDVYLPLGLSRLILVCYIFGCPANFLVWRPRLWICASVAIAILLQVLFLRIQNSRKGPFFFVPEAYRPSFYNYFRSFDEERSIEGSSECIICMTVLNVPQAKKEEVSNTSKTMHTPCGHRFHTDCLGNWMKLKLECPTCRSPLPALEEDDV